MTDAGRAAESTIFDSVAEQACRAFHALYVAIARPDGDGALRIVGGTAMPPEFRNRVWQLGELPASAQVLATGRAARSDDFTAVSGPMREFSRDQHFSTSVAAPIVIDDELWGIVMVVGNQRMGPDVEGRLTDFTHVITGSIVNLRARDELRELANEQRALRRVATLVAEQRSPGEVFDAVAEELLPMMGATTASLVRFEGRELIVADAFGRFGDLTPLGTRLTLDDGDNLSTRVLQTGRPAWMSHLPAGITGAIGARVHLSPVRDLVMVPILAAGEIWGAAVFSWVNADPVHGNPPERLMGFTDLIGQAVVNADAKAKLLESRVRIVNAGDETRRQIERNLHDGVQQRLVALGLRLRTLSARGAVPDSLQGDIDRITADLEEVLDEIRVFSQGLHPVILARAGLAPSLRSLARRSPIPVEVEVNLGRRFAAPAETAVYFLVSEGLANAAKHSHASLVRVNVSATPQALHATVSDDGRGGASITTGSGLIGLMDRAEALGGELTLTSAPGRGTTLAITLPLT